MLSKEIIEELYNKHSKELFVYIFRMLGEHDLAEDILQDCYTKLIDYSIKKEVRLETVRAFLYKTAHNLCINTIKHKSRSSISSDDMDVSYNDSFTQKVELDELNKRIYELVEKMDFETRSIFILRKENQKSNLEIARNLGVSERTVRRKLKRALETIAVQLEREGIV